VQIHLNTDDGIRQFFWGVGLNFDGGGIFFEGVERVDWSLEAPTKTRSVTETSISKLRR